MRREVARQIIAGTRDTYDSVASEFSRTRQRFWGELAYLKEHAVPGARVLDLGCGNGRFYDLLEDRSVGYVGLDISEGLLREARKRHPEATFVRGDATELPFQDASFDAVFSFAVLHHIPSEELRARFISEMRRVLRPGGTLIVSAWSLYDASHLLPLLWSWTRALATLSPSDGGDLWLTFGKERRVRYVHALTERKMRDLLERGGFGVRDTEFVARESGSGARNIVAVATRA